MYIYIVIASARRAFPGQPQGEELEKGGNAQNRGAEPKGGYFFSTRNDYED
jgi:hypothetical protein